MGFYENKKEANTIIDSMFMEGKSFCEIEFKISQKFGFGKQMIINRIQLLKELQEN